MPYICLARDGIPDGVVQILDLSPNTSLRNPVIDPQGQTRYVNRVQNNLVYFDAVGVTRDDLLVGLCSYLVDRVDPIPGSIGPAGWDQATQLAVSGAIIGRMDTGLPMTLADVNTIVQIPFPTTDFDGTASPSTGILTELLAILSGRGYQLSRGFVKGPGGVWDVVPRGAFTVPVLVYGTSMQDGEIRPVNIGGDVEYREVKGIRYNSKTGSFLISLNTGALGVFEAKAGRPPVTLWPDSDAEPFYPWTYQHGLQFAPVTHARVVTVYDDDGTVL